jgi:hypothetical protein
MKTLKTVKSMVRIHVEQPILRGRALRDFVKIPARRNGLRHGFVSFHFAMNANENLTAAEAGNSPGMVHKNYKGLATKTEAEQWFNVKPAETAGNIILLAANNAAE